MYVDFEPGSDSDARAVFDKSPEAMTWTVRHLKKVTIGMVLVSPCRSTWQLLWNWGLGAVDRQG